MVQLYYQNFTVITRGENTRKVHRFLKTVVSDFDLTYKRKRGFFKTRFFVTIRGHETDLHKFSTELKRTAQLEAA